MLCFVVSTVLLLYTFQPAIGVRVCNLYTIKAEIKCLAQLITRIASIISVGFNNAHNYV